MRIARIDWALGAVLVVMAIGVSACGSSSSSTASSNLPTSIGAGDTGRRAAPASAICWQMKQLAGSSSFGTRLGPWSLEAIALVAGCAAAACSRHAGPVAP